VTPAWLIRTGLALAIIASGWLVFKLVTYLSLNRVRKIAHRLENYQPGKAAIVYFTTPDCLACKAAQHPALMRLQSLLGDQLQVIEINAYEDPDMAKDWGVLSVPTTFILDSKGAPRQVNYGVTPAEKLYDQLRQTKPQAI
jgi:thiol-disulfide isomerase/thioredoxin